MFTRGEVVYADPGSGDASHREPVAIFTGEVLPQYAGDLDDGTVRKLLDELAEEMGPTLEQEEVNIASSGRTWTLTAEPVGPYMPLQNRVTAFGDIVASAQRGVSTGNRGIIHDPATKTLLKKRWATKAWLVCVLGYKRRRREVM